MKLICATCSKEFDREDKEYRRQIKKGRNRFFCSRSCAILKNLEEKPRKGNVQLLKADNRKDEHTPFRWFVRRGQYRDKKRGYGCDLTVQFLKQLWEEQRGICPFTGWKLILPKDSEEFENKNIANASIDRIDNSLGYMQGNVRFISVMANFARQTYSDEELIAFCKAVAAHSL
jgi:hypothetical protein